MGWECTALQPRRVLLPHSHRRQVPSMRRPIATDGECTPVGQQTLQTFGDRIDVDILASSIATDGECTPVGQRTLQTFGDRIDVDILASSIATDGECTPVGQQTLQTFGDRIDVDILASSSLSIELNRMCLTLCIKCCLVTIIWTTYLI